VESNIPPGVIDNTDRFYTMVKSVSEFDSTEVKPIIQGLLATTDEENYFVGTYYRARCHLDTVLELKNVIHFQAAAMLARGLFELAVDMRLLEVTPMGWLKMLAFVDVEKLRCARKIVKFAKSHPTSGVETSTFEAFIATKENQIDHKQRILWPTLTRVGHWSGLKLGVRVKQLGDPFDAIYEVQYPRLSWSVHSGLTGIVNLKAETFAHMCADAFKLSADAYCEVLKASHPVPNRATWTDQAT